ncbi:MAG: FHA domain-containing protein [Galactobacter sp.]
MPVRAQPLAVPGVPFQAQDGGWVFPLPADGALVLLSHDGTETLVLGTDPEVLVPNVVAVAYRSAVTPTGRRARSARHAAQIVDDAAAASLPPTVPRAAPVGAQGPQAPEVEHTAEAEPDATRPASDTAERGHETPVAASAASDCAHEADRTQLGVPDDRTVTGSDLHRLLADRAGAQPDTPDDHTVLGTSLPSPGSDVAIVGSTSAKTPAAPSPASEATQFPADQPPAVSSPMSAPAEATQPKVAPVRAPQPPAMQAPTPGSTMLAATLPGQLPVPAPPQPVEDPGQRPPVVRVEDSAGETEIPLDAAMVVGTEPAAGSVRYRDARLVPVQGATVSRSHACLRVQSGVVLVCDLWSTNGTRIKMPGQAPFRLRDGEEVPVTAGTVVELGDGVTLSVPSMTDGCGGHGS